MNLCASVRCSEPTKFRIRHYCLKCFQDIPPEEVVCASCGFHNLPSLRLRYWNLHPEIVFLQNFLRYFVFLLVLGAWFALYLKQGVIGAYIYWIPAIPLLIGILLWITISRLTRHDQYLKCSIVWQILFLVGAVMFFLWGYWWLSIPCIALALATCFIGRLFFEWKFRKVIKEA